MSRLTAKRLYGIWEGVTLTWDENYRFDEETYAKNVSRAIDAKVHGVYTTGSTGEFYALEYDEFCRMVDITVELCGKAGMPLQIGCSTDATAKTIKLMEYAAGKEEVGAVQTVIPYWMAMTERELLQFFKDVYTALPEVPLVHYNVTHAKHYLDGEDYKKILDVAPNLIGVKFNNDGAYFAELQDAILMTPSISYFVLEHLLVSSMRLGARGCYSSLVATNPKYTLDMYAKAEAGQWDEAIKMQQHASRFCADVNAFAIERNEGLSSPVSDKGLSVAAGRVLGHQRCRPPYIGWSDKTVKELRVWLKANYPEFVYPED